MHQMRMRLAVLAALFAATPVFAQNVLLEVDDGDHFYCTPSGPGDCQESTCHGDSNDPAEGEAMRHWHAGLPFLGKDAEVAGGFGCLGGPKTWDVTVTHGASLSATIRYTWDQDVPGGGLNDVHLNIYDESGNRVYSSATDPNVGINPIVPGVTESLTHEIVTGLPPGTYTIEEDVFFGEHTAWLTKLKVVDGNLPD